MTERKNQRSSRRKGQNSRDRMREQRSRPPEINPAPSGATGGQYQPLSDAEITRIYDTAFRMLAELGMGDTPLALQEQCVSKGATVNQQGRVCFSRGMVEGIIDGACKSVVLHGREARHTIEAGGDRVYFGTGGAAVQTYDYASSSYRP